jgi:hypothetical protein
MFMINLRGNVKIGDTVPCNINRKPAHVTWRDKTTLVIDSHGPRRIFFTKLENGLRADVDVWMRAHTVRRVRRDKITEEVATV